MELLARTGVGRDINRPYLARAEIEAHLRRPVVRRLLDLIRFRNTHPAFEGDFHLREGGRAEVLEIGWESPGAGIEATIDLAGAGFELMLTEAGEKTTITDWEDFA
jgi:sucrose phosphorylase